MKQFIIVLLIGLLSLLTSSISFAQNPDAFITIWRTTEAKESITIETNPDYTYDYTIDWGDGKQKKHVKGDIKHKYKKAGDHIITITGKFPAFQGYINPGNEDYDRPRKKFKRKVNNRKKLIEIKQWGSQEWETMEYALSRCSNLNKMDTSAPNLSKVKSLKGMFANASSFNQPINNWNTANVVNMYGMFDNATSFNQPIDNWNTSMVTDIRRMFYRALSFNQSLNKWDLSKITDMNGVFREASSFNQSIDQWDTSNVTSMHAMFCEADSFNQPINNWNTAKVSSMKMMFNGADSFNQPINNWNTSNVINMSYMFKNASSFNQPLDKWNTSMVKDMRNMFNKTKSFNQSLEKWDISNVSKMNRMFVNTKLSTENYDKTLIGWAHTTSTKKGSKYINLGAESLTYCAEEARQLLIENYNWAIQGDSKAISCNKKE